MTAWKPNSETAFLLQAASRNLAGPNSEHKEKRFQQVAWSQSLPTEI
jgi:hypothetical protein